MTNVYIGYDAREDAAWRVCVSSLLRHSSTNITIKPLIQKELRDNGFYTRKKDDRASTEFTYTRFMVPFLNQYEGWAIYCDCDFLWLNDVRELISSLDTKFAVYVVKHDYKPTNKTKMDGKEQSQYPRKNWSSLIIWNCAHPSNAQLSLDTINQASPSYLHRFSWLNDFDIGEISLEWNWLVGWYQEPQDGTPRALHYTEGGPWFDEYKQCEYADLWLKEYELFRNHTL